MNPEIDLVYGLIGIALYRFWSPSGKYLTVISILIVGLLFSQVLLIVNDTDSLAVLTWLMCSLGLVVFYYLRRKNTRWRGINYFKLSALALIIIYPTTFDYLLKIPTAHEVPLYASIKYCMFALVGLILVYDRWILNNNSMKKKFIIFLLAQSAALILLLIYSYTQHLESWRQHIVAEENRIEAEQQRTLREEAIKDLEECKQSIRDSKAD